MGTALSTQGLFDTMPEFSRGSSPSFFERAVRNLLSEAGIEINGDRPWDLRVRDPRFFGRLLVDGSLGAGESYMEGWWDCSRLDELFCRVIKTGLSEKLGGRFPGFGLLSRFLNLQSRRRSLEVAVRHYDIGNDLYRSMLDSRMTYSCGYWRRAAGLEEAQEDKLDLVCRKLLLKPGMTLLDIGCGWGGLARFAAENYGVSVVGVTISREQGKIARDVCKGRPVEIRLQDYRDLDQKFDRIVSVGMFEHVGYKNYPLFMKIAHRCLDEDGLFLLHTIGGNTSQTCTDPWLHKYIFPNSVIPSAAQIAKAAEGLFVLEDWHNFGPDYDKTLMAWHANFQDHWEDLKSRYDERFRRMWSYYLLSCAGSFRSRKNQLWQFVFSKKGMAGEYASVR